MKLGRSHAAAPALLAVFLIIFGAKLSLIHQYSMPHPFWDSWHVEGDQLYKPFLLGTLRLSDLVSPANEHRPVILRAHALLLLALNKQWDVQLQMEANAALFALFGCLLYWQLARSFGAVGEMCLTAMIILCLALPSGWENTLNGHHAGWFYFYLFSASGLWLTIAHTSLSRFWWLGAASLALAYFSLFAGIISIAVAALAGVFRLVCLRKLERHTIAGAVILGAMFVAGMIIKPQFAAETAIHASSLKAFLTALGYALAWPYFPVSARALVLHAPAAILLVLLIMRRFGYTPALMFIVALAAWSWMQAVGIAYARGFDGMPPVVRYMEILTVGLLAAFTAALAMISKTSGWRRLAALALLGAWLMALAPGLQATTNYTYDYMLPVKKQMSMTQDFNIREFVSTGDRSYLDHKPDADISYYGGAEQLAKYLTDPAIRGVLPSSVREPLHVQWATDSNADRGHGQPPTASSELPDPDAQTTFTAEGSAAVMHLESTWLPPPNYPYLQFRVAGTLGSTGIALDLVTKSGQKIHVISDRMPPRGWTSIDVPSPREPFHIVAVDDSATGWLTFSAPREMGRLSYYAEWLGEHARSVMFLGYCFTILFLVVQIRRVMDQLPERKVAS